MYLTFNLEVQMLYCSLSVCSWCSDVFCLVFRHFNCVFKNYKKRLVLQFIGPPNLLTPILINIKQKIFNSQHMHKIAYILLYISFYFNINKFLDMQLRVNSLGEIQEDSIIWNTQSNKAAHLKSEHKIDIAEVFTAHKTFIKTQTITQTSITHNKHLSQLYKANIFFKREDLQKGKTYKIRGGLYYYLKKQQEIRKKGFVVVSDGNFATSVALLSSLYQFKCIIFVPYCCFQHKVDAIKNNGKEFVQLIQDGDDFQQCEQIAKKYAEEHQLPFVQPHSSELLMPGYATIAKEIIDEERFNEVDYIVVPSGGGALVSSIASVMKQVSPNTKVIAVQPDICTPFSNSIMKGQMVSSEKVSKFCNGSSVKRIGENCFKVGRTCVDGFVSVTQNKLAETIIKLYSMGYICEPSGALAVAGLNKMRNQIAGKNVVCILTGSNMDLSRLQQARQLNVISKGYKNYYIVEFPNRKKGMYELLTKCFKKTDVISIQYAKKANKDINQAIIAVQSPSQQNVEYSISQMLELKFKVQNITDRSELLQLIF